MIMKFEFTNYVVTIDYNLSLDSAASKELPNDGSTDYCDAKIYDKLLDKAYELCDNYYDILKEMYIENENLLGEVAQICCTIGDYAFKKIVGIANQYIHLDSELRHKAIVEDGLAVVVHKYNQMKKLEIVFDTFYNYYLTDENQININIS